MLKEKEKGVAGLGECAACRRFNYYYYVVVLVDD